jgi:hypothetical protein
VSKLIGLCGYCGSGKDEAAKALIANGWHQMSFAEPLRRMALALDPYIIFGSRLSDVVANVGWTEAKKNPEVRRTLQKLGTEAVRDIIGFDTWVQLADRTMPSDRDVVFTDVRFANEAEMIWGRGGRIYRIERPGYVPATNHVSESYPFNPDGKITNGGTVDDLHREILRIAGLI